MVLNLEDFWVLLWKGLLTSVGLYALTLVLGNLLEVRKALKLISGLPCRQINWFHPGGSVISFVLGSFDVAYPGPGRAGYLRSYFSLYKQYGSTILGSVYFWEAKPVFWVADADAHRVVTTDLKTFNKALELYEGINMYGKHLVSTEGATWRRHRTIANPAFNEANTALVWSETIRLLPEWFSIIEGRQNGASTEPPVVDLVREVTRLNLLVLMSAAFGSHSSLTSFQPPPTADSIHTLSFQAALAGALDALFFRVLSFYPLMQLLFRLPIPSLQRKLHQTTEAYDELKSYMLEMISSARNSFASGPRMGTADAVLLRNLVEANSKQEGEHKSLTDDELVADVFMFILAGHETSSHAVSFAITLLAFYPEVQRKLYEEVKRVWPNGSPAMGSISTYKEDFIKLVYTHAVFQETLRHYPVVHILAKVVAEDTTLPGRRFTPGSNISLGSADKFEKFDVPVPKGSHVILDIQGLQMNPMYWGEDAREFKPERFIDTDTYRWPRDAFLAFSAGARKCIGTRFAGSASVAIIANLVYSYEITLAPEIDAQVREMERRGVGVVERMEWLCKWKVFLTSTPCRAKVRVKRRV